MVLAKFIIMIMSEPHGQPHGYQHCLSTQSRIESSSSQKPEVLSFVIILNFMLKRLPTNYLNDSVTLSLILDGTNGTVTGT
jgi:hypothetical protein